MENAVQALKTGAAVLIFIIAITTSFVMFSKAKTTADAVISAQDKQKYLESAEVDNGILYTSSETIQSQNDEGESKIKGMTIDGYRIVGINDVISTLYRYSIEKYGVTIIETDGDIIARFDSSTESNIVKLWNDMNDASKEEFIKQWEENTTVKYNNNIIVPKFEGAIERIYRSKDSDGREYVDTTWYYESYDKIIKKIIDSGIVRRINNLLGGSRFIDNEKIYNYDQLKLKDILKSSKQITEIVNNIDKSKYLEVKEGENTRKTDLQTEYQMPTLEIIYILEL